MSEGLLFKKLIKQHWPFLLAALFHISLIFYGFVPGMVMLNTTHDVGAVSAAIDITRSLRQGNFLSVYLTPQIYPLGFSLLMLPVAAVFLGINAIFHLGQFNSFALYAYHYVGLFYISARLIIFFLFVAGYYFLVKITDYIPVKENIKKIGLYLYLFSPLSLLFSFQERIHLPAALLMVPTFYFGLRFMREHKMAFGIIAAILAGVSASTVQYGGIIFVGLMAGFIFSEFLPGRRRKIYYLILLIIIFFATSLLVGYPSLLVGNLEAILNKTHYSAISFNGSGLLGMILALWRYEAVLFIFFVCSIIKYFHHGGRKISELIYVIAPLLLFILVFGLYGSFYDRQLGGVITLFILVSIYFWPGDVSRKIANFILCLLIIINLLIASSLHIRKPTFVDIYNVLRDVSQANDIVLDTAGITSYLDIPSVNLTKKYNDEFTEQVLFLDGQGGNYKHFPFVLLIIRDKNKIKSIIKNESPRFIIIHQEEDKENIRNGYSLLAEIGGRKKFSVFMPLPFFPGRSGWQIWEKTKD